MHNLSLARSHFVLLPLLIAATFTGCRQAPVMDDQNDVANVATNQPVIPRKEPALDRASLLAAVAQAASASAAGTGAPAGTRSLDGRQFEVRIRFGCRGPSEPTGKSWLNWSFDPDTRTIRLQARPTLSEEDPVIAKVGGENVEAAEGFWIPRPWLLSPVCPATAAIRPSRQAEVKPESEPAQSNPSAEPQNAAAEAPVEPRGETLPNRQRVGIAQFFTDTDSRTGRRDDRPYQAVHVLEQGRAIGSQGFNLVLAGRLRAVPGRGVIECSSTGPDSPPDCVVSAEFQRVWIEMPDSREVIAEWGGG